jgi:LPXTG-site transpeptidase (sortase) family protein
MRIVAAVIGVVVVLVGAADVASRIAHDFFGDSAALTIFAPVAAANDPSVLSALLGGNSAASTTPLVPATLKIPSIGVNANVEKVANKSDGSMGTPNQFGDVAWYEPGQKPGEAGNTVIDGHVNNALTTAGVFEHLSQVNIGDKVVVADAQGKSLQYVVTEMNEYSTNDAPTQEIFSKTGPSQLVLITCDGVWSSKEHSFDKRLVVVARLVQ